MARIRGIISDLKTEPSGKAFSFFISIVYKKRTTGWIQATPEQIAGLKKNDCVEATYETVFNRSYGDRVSRTYLKTITKIKPNAAMKMMLYQTKLQFKS